MFTPVCCVHTGIHSHLITCCHIYCCCLWTGTWRLGSGWREMLFSLQQMAQPWPAGDKLCWVLNGCSLPCFQQFPAERMRHCRLSGKLELSPLGRLFSRTMSKQIASQFVWGSTAGHYQVCTVSAVDGAVGREAEKSWSCKIFAHRQEGDTSISLLLPDWRWLSSSHSQEEKTHASEWQMQSWMSLCGISFTWGGRIHTVAWKDKCSVSSSELRFFSCPQLHKRRQVPTF